jgi:hypothetical protein
MKNIEKDLVLEILKYDTNNEKIEYIIKNNKINWMEILGFISYHRVSGLFYSKMDKINIRLLDYPVFFSSYMTNQAQKIRNDQQLIEIKKISKEFNSNKIDYIFLKGTILNQIIFKSGERASNDIDILINKDSIVNATNSLKKLGYIQGKYDYKKDTIIEYNEDELEQSLLSKGETCPFIKKSNNLTIKTFDVDLNFSLDWTPDYDQNIIFNILNNKEQIVIDDIQVYSANIYDNIIELCIHLYKDMSLIDIIKKRKVFDLYKLIDIYYLINLYFDKIDFHILEVKIKKINAENYVYFALKYINAIFDDFNHYNIIDLIGNLEKYITDSEILNVAFDQYNENIKLYSYSDLKERIFKYNVIDDYTKINLL